MRITDRDGARILVVRHHLDAWDGACAQERQYRSPIVRWPITQLDCDRAGRAHGLLRHTSSPQRRRRTLKEMLEGLVETPDAAEARGRGHLRHRQPCVLDQLL